jgi:hypothetical protein
MLAKHMHKFFMVLNEVTEISVTFVQTLIVIETEPVLTSVVLVIVEKNT